MLNKLNVELQCEEMARNLLISGRCSNMEDLAFWLTSAANIGYQLGWHDRNKNEPCNPPVSLRKPNL